LSELASEAIAERSRREAPLTREDFDALLDGISEGVTVRAPDGQIVYANEAASHMLGASSAEELLGSAMGTHRQRFELFDIDGRPLDPVDLPGERVRLGESEAELFVRFRPVGGGDEQVSFTRSIRINDAQGGLRYVVSFFRSVTDEKAAVMLRKLERVTKAALSHFSLRDLVPSLLEEIRLVLAAETAAILLLDEAGENLVLRVSVGFQDEELNQAVPVPLGKGLAGYVAAQREPWLVTDLDEIDLVSPTLKARGIRSLVAAPLVAANHRVIGVVHAGSEEKGFFSKDDIQLLELIADRVALAVDHSASRDAEHAAQERLSFLGEASSLLASSLNYEDTLARVAQLAVPRLADWCSVDILAEDGSIRRLATTHVDPDKVRRGWELSERYPTDPADDNGVPLVLRTGEPQLMTEIPRVLLDEAVAEHPELKEILDELGLRSMMIVPISARGRTLGAISFFWAESGRNYSEADLELAADLARRAGIAVDNAQLYRAAEERSQAARVLASIGDGVMLVDGKGIVRYWNRAAEAITGIPASAVLDRSAADAIPGWSAAAQRVPISFDPVASPRAQSLPLGSGEPELWLSITGVAVVDGTVYAFRDLTEERALDALKTEFVSTVSHELRTPLAAIYGAAMTLRREDVVLDAEQNETLLGVITNESDRLARTVNAILWASRLDTGTLSAMIEPCNPLALASDVVEAQRVHLPPRIRLELDAPQDAATVAADPDKVRQVLVNLLDNAVKYSPDGGEVRLSIGSDGHRVRFSISDEGLGIPYAEQRRIFDKFYRVDPQMTRGIGGTGLGLYICRELVRRMDGRIWVTSEPGRGSTFAFELPVA
jgi:signal transduction histidine kinase/putative methionine-R-sulfoxide reductase with GAF domain